MKTKYWLTLIFILVLFIRILASFTAPGFSYDTYDILREVEHILDTGRSLLQDELSHGGRDRVFSPVYGYILAFFGLFLSLDMVMLIIPNLFGSTIVIVVYMLAFEISKNKQVSVLTSLLSGIIPFLFLGTVNNASNLNLVIPLFLLTIYYFLKTNQDKKHRYHLVFSLIFLSLIHPISIALVVGLLIYLVFLKIKNFRESNREFEVVLFFSLLVFWLNLIIYKQALFESPDIFIWQSLPTVLTDSVYAQIGTFQAIYGIGSVLLVLGLLSVYFNLFDKKKKSVTLFMSLAILFIILLISRNLELLLGLIFLGIIFCVLSSYSLKVFYDILINMKYNKAIYVLVILVVSLQIALFIPSFNATTSGINTPTELDYKAAIFMQNFDMNSKILARYYEGSFISFVSGRKNVIDSDFLLVANVDSFYSDAHSVYDDRFLTSALSKLTRLGVTHIFLSEKYQIQNNKTELAFVDNDCIVKIYPTLEKEYLYHPKIYEVRCQINE